MDSQGGKDQGRKEGQSGYGPTLQLQHTGLRAIAETQDSSAVLNELLCFPLLPACPRLFNLL